MAGDESRFDARLMELTAHQAEQGGQFRPAQFDLIVADLHRQRRQTRARDGHRGRAHCNTSHAMRARAR